jgi:3-methyladenine DNA glycosylase AlkD
MHPYIKLIGEELLNLADTERAVGAKAYMKNQFDFFGMTMAARRQVCKEYMNFITCKSK